MGSQCLTFKLDTGAEVTAVMEDAYSSLQGKPLQKPPKILYRPGRKPLAGLGEFTPKLQCRDKTTNRQIFVVKRLGRNMLALPAVLTLDLITTVATVGDYKTAIQKAHPKVFQGLGQFGEPYLIKLRQDAQPHALFTRRRVPLPLCHKVEGELCRIDLLECTLTQRSFNTPVHEHIDTPFLKPNSRSEHV